MKFMESYKTPNMCCRYEAAEQYTDDDDAKYVFRAMQMDSVRESNSQEEFFKVRYNVLSLVHLSSEIYNLSVIACLLLIKYNIRLIAPLVSLFLYSFIVLYRV